MIEQACPGSPTTSTTDNGNVSGHNNKKKEKASRIEQARPVTRRTEHCDDGGKKSSMPDHACSPPKVIDTKTRKAQDNVDGKNNDKS